MLFALVVPLAVLPWVHVQYRRFGRLRGWSAFVAAAGVLYGCGLVAFTLFPLPVVDSDFCTKRRLLDYWQLQPLESLNDVARDGGPAVWQLALNVVLFLPLGFLAGYRFREPLLAAVGIGLLTSVAVEVTQGTALFGLYPCPYRLADVDDVMTNTAGALVGWLLSKPLTRVLPPATAAPVADTAPPGLIRRGLAFAGDLLVIELTRFTVLAVLALAGATTRAWTTDGRFTTALAVAVTTGYTLVLPTVRADRATPGQFVFNLALQRTRGGPARRWSVLVRFVLWWLPVLWLALSGHTGLLLLAALAIGLLARFTEDRRSLLGLLSATRTTTRAALTDPAPDRPPAPAER
ncbi:VanZ family protein [Saccharothrix obliqua]|uniref:VanZ family protein n=1 Tax=Saccharothrix obliqua TaxID=2861747 RepID=UPI001C5F7E10|nr:VanZ family protein [Saccharothrix obliqua]MBW4716745.1 VanZ family protein [Saccharothrix obliqua]